MSTILDALRKAQSKGGDGNGDAAEKEPVASSRWDASQAPASQMASPPPPQQPSPSSDENFDDPRPRGSLLTARNNTTVVTIGLAVAGLLLGVSAAQIWLGNWSVPFVGGSEQIAAVTGPPSGRTEEAATPKTRSTLPSERGKRGRDGRGSAKAATEGALPASPPAPEGAPPAVPTAIPGGTPNNATGAAPTAPVRGAPPPAGIAPGPHAVAPPAQPQLYGGRVPAPGTPPAAPAPLQAQGSVPAAPSAGPAPGAGAAPGSPGARPGAAVPGANIPSVIPGAPPGPPAAMVLGNAGAPAPAGLPPPAQFEPPQPAPLGAPPTGAPEVSLLFIQYSRDIARRVASLRGPGGKLMLVHEGDKVEGMEVASIRADSIELDWNGTKFLLLASR